MSNGIAFKTTLPDPSFDAAWDAIKVPEAVKTRLVAQALLSLTMRRKVAFEIAPLHGIIILAGPAGTGKTTIARGLASRIAGALKGEKVTFLQIDPHGLASAALGKSQQQVTTLFNRTIPEAGLNGPAIVLLDEVETLAADRRRMSLEANPVDVHRATDAVLSGVDQLTREHPHILLVATTNYPEAVDSAFLSRADLLETFELPNLEARAEIIADTLRGLAISWPPIAGLVRDVGRFSAASEGLDGRRLRKAIVSAAALSFESARDPGKLTSAQILEVLHSLTKKRGGRREAA
jgi:AAA+ superfamily predicted ATPase